MAPPFARNGIAAALVPAADVGIVEIDQNLIDQLLAIQAEAGDDALTEEEAAMLAEVMPQRNLPDPIEVFEVNLAEYLDESTLGQIAQDVIDWVDRDEESRKAWFERERKGILLLGVTEQTEGGATFKGASKVVHPLLAEACVQFQARAIAELWPSTGPVKTTVLGTPTPELQEQAERVGDYMNYQYTQEMPGAFNEQDTMLFRLPLSGSCFKKAYYDPLEAMVCTKFVDCTDFLAPYSATDLRTTPRFTHRFFWAGNDVRRAMHAGWFRKIDLMEPRYDTTTDGEAQEVKDVVADAEGRSETPALEDGQHTLLECACYYDLPGFDHTDEHKRPTGIALPYIITVERDSQKVLAIRRNWRKNDPLQRKRVYVTHYKFLPGLGFYGFGFLHIIGGLSRAATGALRALLDAAQFANLRAGFKSKDAKIPSGDVPLGPGEWRDTDATHEELTKAFFKIDYDEPSLTLFNLLGLLDETGRRFAGTTEAVVGEASNNGPVGTTLALIEQGLKVFSGIHKRLHTAAGEEYKIVAELDHEYLPDEYPYRVQGADRAVRKLDFDERVDVAPVSDPNIVSSTQRIAQSQAVYQLAKENPDLYDRRQVQEGLLRALRVPNIEEVLPDRSKARRMGPVEEGAAFLIGKPARVYADQAHDAHMLIHQNQFAQLPPDMQGSPIGQAVMAHIQEHMAYQYLISMQATTGVQFDMRLLQGEDAEQEQGEEIPPELENEIALAVAQAVQNMQLSPPPQPDPAVMKTEADISRKDAEAQASIARKDAEAGAAIERKNAETNAALLRKYQEHEQALVNKFENQQA